VVVHTPVSPTIITHTPTTSTTTASSTVVAPVVNILQGPFKDLCASQASAFRLWLILLVLYTIVVGGLLWLEFPISWAWAQTAERVAIAILGLLVLLLGFWYFSAACRAALWMPLVAFLVAVLGLLAAFWNHPKIVQLLLIEEPKLPPVVPTPPSSSKK
jgi:phosphoglycerol transferase MdoB-like AlkP superfamily enzyme